MVREHTFEGVVTNLERRYRETDSMAVKEELAKFINKKDCPSCDGARLRDRSAQREGRHRRAAARDL